MINTDPEHLSIKVAEEIISVASLGIVCRVGRTQLIVGFRPIRFGSAKQSVGHENPTGYTQTGENDYGNNDTRRGCFVYFNRGITWDGREGRQ